MSLALASLVISEGEVVVGVMALQGRKGFFLPAGVSESGMCHGRGLF